MVSIDLRERIEGCRKLYSINTHLLKKEDGLFRITTVQAELISKQLFHGYECIIFLQYDKQNLEELRIMQEFYDKLLGDCTKLEKGLIQKSPEYEPTETTEYTKRREISKQQNQKLISYLNKDTSKHDLLISKIETQSKWYQNSLLRDVFLIITALVLGRLSNLLF